MGSKGVEPRDEMTKGMSFIEEVIGVCCMNSHALGGISLYEPRMPII